MSDFDRQLDRLPPAVASPLLPLTHVTEWARFLSIARSGEIASSRPCSVYGEHLVYAFYGRPAYRDDDPTTFHATAYSPVCLLLKPSSIGAARRIAPFDTGAFGKKYKSAMHPTLNKEDFEMRIDPSSPSKVVGAFWGDNRSYYTYVLGGMPRPGPADVALECYIQLITAMIPTAYDERCSTVELQFSSPVRMSDVLEALIVPECVVNSDLRDLAKATGFELLPYEFEMPFKKGDFYREIKKSVKGFLVDRYQL